MMTHPFERAGLGTAPFRVIGVECRTGPIRTTDPVTGITTEIGSPGQPMGCCQYCYQGISECWLVRSSDGKVFTVGCDCVRKTSDPGLKRGMAPLKTKLRKEREAARIERAELLIEDPAVRARLAEEPSPNARRPGDTALEWASWMLLHAGNSGKLRACRLLEEVAS